MQNCLLPSFDLLYYSNRPKKVHLSRYLISLLHFGGVPAEFFLGLLSSALAEAESCCYDKGAALRGKFYSFSVNYAIMSHLHP